MVSMRDIISSASIRIGVVGYSDPTKYDAQKGTESFYQGMEELLSRLPPGDGYELVSGLTDQGIPAIAYRYATDRGWRTVGIACGKAGDYEVYPVDHSIIVGDEWGDESDTFIGYIDCLLRVGGGKQSFDEVERFREANPDGVVVEVEL